MAVQILSLAFTTISVQSPGNPPGNLYTSPLTPTALTTIVKSIRLVNTDTATRTVNLWFQPNTGTKRRIGPVNMTIPAGTLAIDDQEITMGAGDQIIGDASVVNVIDVVISGIQR